MKTGVRWPRILAAAAMAAAVLAPSPFFLAGGAAAQAPRSAQDWSHHVTRTAAGAYVLGNPDAKVKLVEYFSLTCPHCAHFEQEALPALGATYIKSGRVSLEMRHALRDPADFAASLLARCAGPAGYFGAIDLIFARQEQWFEKVQAYQSANLDKLKAMSPDAALDALARNGGLIALVESRGVTPARANACLASKTEKDLLGKMAAEAWNARKIEGTPTFLINGTAVPDTTTWAELKPKLDAALK